MAGSGGRRDDGELSNPLPNQEAGIDFIGEVIDGRYEITRRLAKGGMAHVFLAKDRTRKCHVAIRLHRAPACTRVRRPPAQARRRRS